eukprot:scaffold94116_cov30-Tisochrysis_lutea.AAC.3
MRASCIATRPFGHPVIDPEERRRIALDRLLLAALAHVAESHLSEVGQLGRVELAHQENIVLAASRRYEALYRFQHGCAPRCG